jgi:GNAT superfamily N-acetyltransferase
MDMGDDAEVRRWLAVHNAAFRHRWGLEEYRRAILEHPHFVIRHTIFVIEGDTPLGVASAGTFRRNPSVGVGHYLGVVPGARGRGLGRALVLERFRLLREARVGVGESETTLSRTSSLALHLNLGFRPKYELDPWNSPDEASPLLRALANARLRRLHHRFGHILA